MVFVEDINKLDSFSNLKILCGRNGLQRKVLCTNIAQTSSIQEWLVGGDVIFMTGIGLDTTPEFLNNIVKQAVDCHSACLVILVNSNYIKEIHDDTIQYADSLNFPIFQAPWESKIANMIHEISNAVFKDRYKECSMNKFLEDFLYNRLDLSLEENIIKINEYKLMGLHFVVVINLVNDKSNIDYTADYKSSRRRQLTTCIIYHMKSMFPMALYINRGSKIVFIVKSDNSDTTDRNKLNEVYNKVNCFYKNYSVLIGVGKKYDNPQELCKSFNEANAVGISPLSKGVVFYDELGMEQLFYYIKDKEIFNNFVDNRIGMLQQYDRKNRTDLLLTLSVYLKENCSIAEASKALYFHRNTVMKRIEKIEEILDVSLEDAETRYELYTCIKLLDIYS